MLELMEQLGSWHRLELGDAPRSWAGFLAVLSALLPLHLPLHHLGLITVQCSIRLCGVCTSVSGPFAILKI